jgi:thiol:disulfide interchange protein DsbG
VKLTRLLPALLAALISLPAAAGPVEDYAAKNNYRVLLQWKSLLPGWKGYLANGANGPKVLYLSPDQVLVYGVISDPRTGKEVTPEDIRRNQDAITAALTGQQLQPALPPLPQAAPAPAAGPKTTSYDMSKWPGLERTVSYVRDGKVGSKDVVYIFFDPKCPHCHNFFRTIRTIGTTKELRWIPVGILSEESKTLAAAVLTDARGGRAMDDLMDGRLLPAPGVSQDIKAKLNANVVAMKTMGVTGVPLTVYRQNGQVLFETGNIGPDIARVIR